LSLFTRSSKEGQREDDEEMKKGKGLKKYHLFYSLFKKYHFRPKKQLGQNFLIDKRVVKDLIRAAELKKEETVLEVGPGLGSITEELVKIAKKVIVVEKDKRLIEILKNNLEQHLAPDYLKRRVKIIYGDILKFNPKRYSLNAKRYKIVANPPYCIICPLIKKFLQDKDPPKLMVLLVQKEVAERMCAKPPKMSLLSVTVQLFSKIEIVKMVKKESFFPEPKVDSSIVRIKPLRKSKLIDLDLFFKIVKTGFSHPRKQLKNNLKEIFGNKTERILKQTGIDSYRRAETLSLEEWILLAKNFKK